MDGARELDAREVDRLFGEFRMAESRKRALKRGH
jgi:hypothetical protein